MPRNPLRTVGSLCMLSEHFKEVVMRYVFVSLFVLGLAAPSVAELRPEPLRGQESSLAAAVESCGHVEPQLASRGDAGFLAVWIEDGNVVARRVGTDGLPDGDQVAVSAAVSGVPGKASAVRVARAVDGTFLVAWLHQATAARREILLRRLDDNGTPAGAAQVIVGGGPIPALGPAALAVASTGTFALAWSELDTGANAAPRLAIKVRRFNAAGGALGGVVTLATAPKTDLAHQVSPQLEALFAAPGALAVAWSRSRDGAVFARTLADNVPFGSEPFVLYPGHPQQREQRIVLASDGTGVVVAGWLRSRNDPGISLHLLDSASEPTAGPDIRLAGPTPSVLWVDGLSLRRDPENPDRFAIQWVEPLGSDAEAVFARIITRNGGPVGLRFRVDLPTEETFGPQHHLRATQLAFGPGGKLASAWQVWRENPFLATSCDTGVAARVQTFELDEEPVVLPPDPPAGPYLTSPLVPGFRYKVRLAGNLAGKSESACLVQTACVSGAVAGRPEVLLRVVGPRPNGRLWPTIVRFTTAQVEVWIEQIATGTRRYYLLPALDPDSSDLGGTVDRDGFPVV